jgi:hypothetical protein
MRIRKIRRDQVAFLDLILIGTELFRKKEEYTEEMILIETENKSIRFWTRAPFFEVLDYSVLNQAQSERAEGESEKYGWTLLGTSFFRDAEI